MRTSMAKPISVGACATGLGGAQPPSDALRRPDVQHPQRQVQILHVATVETAAPARDTVR